MLGLVKTKQMQPKPPFSLMKIHFPPPNFFLTLAYAVTMKKKVHLIFICSKMGAGDAYLRLIIFMHEHLRMR